MERRPKLTAKFDLNVWKKVLILCSWCLSWGLGSRVGVIMKPRIFIDLTMGNGDKKLRLVFLG